jgi:hypothetical protein
MTGILAVIRDHEAGALQPPPMTWRRCHWHSDCDSVLPLSVFSPTADPFTHHMVPEPHEAPVPIRAIDLRLVGAP